MNDRIERCCACDEPTGRAGAADDSLFTDNEGIGPFCVCCYDGARHVESVLLPTITSLRAEAAEAENAALKGQLCRAREVVEKCREGLFAEHIKGCKCWICEAWAAIHAYDTDPILPCPHAAIAERTKDVEEIAKALYIATEELDSDMGRWAATFDGLKEEGKEMWIRAALAVQKYLKGER